jgi:hypothetical protein
MNFETTTCISLEHDELIQKLSLHFNMSKRSFISALISFIAENEKFPASSFQKLSYRIRSTKWRRLHLVLYPDEYEFFMDVKKVWKMF